MFCRSSPSSRSAEQPNVSSPNPLHSVFVYPRSTQFDVSRPSSSQTLINYPTSTSKTPQAKQKVKLIRITPQRLATRPPAKKHYVHQRDSVESLKRPIPPVKLVVSSKRRKLSTVPPETPPSTALKVIPRNLGRSKKRLSMSKPKQMQSNCLVESPSQTASSPLTNSDSMSEGLFS